MKSTMVLSVICIMAVSVFSSCSRDNNPLAAASDSGTMLAGSGSDKKDATSIQDGTLLRSDGVVITTGYDEWGYNYQARMFNGDYCDAYRDAAWCQPYKGTKLIMKWNDAWLSNVDRDGDGQLDRHPGYTSYIGSGAWLTNHMSGGKGKDKWTYFTKIVAAPADAYKDGGYWYTADGEMIGPVIWSEFATVMEVESGSGATFVSPVGPGFGKFMP